jgi:magnesium transporter
LKTIICYNEHEVKTDGSLDDLENGYNVCIDLVDPDHDELLALGRKLNLDADALETYFNKSKKPEIRVLENHTFTVMLDMKNKDPKTLETEGIYLFTCLSSDRPMSFATQVIISPFSAAVTPFRHHKLSCQTREY